MGNAFDKEFLNTVGIQEDISLPAEMADPHTDVDVFDVLILIGPQPSLLGPSIFICSALIREDLIDLLRGEISQWTTIPGISVSE